jgi:acetylornithine deacetylase
MNAEANDTIELLRALVAIDSVNPSLVPGARGEAEIARFLRGWLEERGIVATLQEAAKKSALDAGAPSRPNVVAAIGPAESLRPALLIIAHLDTVGAGDMKEPFTPRESDGRLYGRGALDIKSGVAAMCAAAARVAREAGKLERSFVIAAVADEECDSIGTQALLKQCMAQSAVVLEPTDLKLCIAHKGYAWFEITTHGRAAHGSMPQEGRDAIRMMGRVLEALDRLDKSLATRPAHRWLGTASVHASLITGGQELSSYPAECRLQIERRTLPGETPKMLEKEIDAMLRELRGIDPEFRATYRRMASRPAYEIDPEEEIVQAASAVLKEVTGQAELSGMSPWTDTALLSDAGIPGVVLGPKGRGLHGAEEFVETESVITLTKVLYQLILRSCMAVEQAGEAR